MKILTSISPKHSNSANQQAAIESWVKYGTATSLNCKDEIALLENKFPIIFKPTDRTMQHLYGKPLVSINAFFEGSEDVLLINSDIIIQSLPEFKQDGITIFSRYDYTEDTTKAKKFENGFDAFFIPAKFLHIFPPSIYALGACWHDYYTPMTAIRNNVPVYYSNQPHMLHKLHDVQYPMHEYFDIGEVFRWEFKLNKKMLIPQVAANTLQIINLKMVRI